MSSDVLTNQPIVLDNGTGVIKAGFAGENTPKVLFPTYSGTPKHVSVMVGALKDQEKVVGKKAQMYRGLLALKRPMEHGVVKNWNDMELIWNAVYQEMRVLSEDHPILVTESPLNPFQHRESTAQVLFETFNVPALFISLQSILSLYASGRMTGIVLDSGAGVTHVVPIVEGFSLPHTIQRIDLAGWDITLQLQRLLRLHGHNFVTSAEMDIVNEIKERQCYVAYDPIKEEQLMMTQPPTQADISYRLPDGSSIKMGSERFRAPEILFDPLAFGFELDSITSLLNHAIHRCDLDLRKTLYSDIVLAGGTTMMTGFANRLLKELQATSPKHTKVRIYAPNQRMHSAWIGGSILAALASFRDMWVSHAEYEEHGIYRMQQKFLI